MEKKKIRLKQNFFKNNDNFTKQRNKKKKVNEVSTFDVLDYIIMQYMVIIVKIQ